MLLITLTVAAARSALAEALGAEPEAADVAAAVGGLLDRVEAAASADAAAWRAFFPSAAPSNDRRDTEYNNAVAGRFGEELLNYLLEIHSGANFHPSRAEAKLKRLLGL